MAWLIFIAILFALFYLFNRGVENHHPWQQSFDLKFSSEEFYKSCQEAIARYEIPGISFSRVNYSEGGLMSANREYLHIERGEHIYDICAAPFGTCFFVSSWYVSKPDFITKVLRLITKFPILAKLAESKTYYQIDTDAMFKSFVHNGMLEAIDAMTNSKGARKLTEYERRMPDSNK
jgi:hypothetical protein